MIALRVNGLSYPQNVVGTGSNTQATLLAEFLIYQNLTFSH